VKFTHRHGAVPDPIDLMDYCQTFELARPFDFRLLHKTSADRYPFLLQSAASDTAQGKFDILFAFPDEKLTLTGFTDLTGPGSEAGPDFLRSLDHWWCQQRCSKVDSHLPFHGGWFLYLGYELAAQIEPSLQLQVDGVLPTAFAVRCPAAFVYEHDSGKAYIVCEAASKSVVRQMLDDADSVVGHGEHAASQSPATLPTLEDNPENYLSAVHTAKEYIAAGDIFQANLSRSWRTVHDTELSADDVYLRLCNTNPAPFAGLVRWGDVALISSSPERLLSIRNRVVSTRPIAGTRPRGDSNVSDSALSEELFAHPKERAEHVMLIDLERNDLGRICTPGSVSVDEFMVLESYAHVHHIVSNICGNLRTDVHPGEAIRAVFPGGTITGCPKVRCMEIISELESRSRGAYTGSFGYLNRDGSLDLNILIRTMVMSGNSIEFKTGSGIVADSDPVAELAETRDKAKGLRLALQ